MLPSLEFNLSLLIFIMYISMNSVYAANESSHALEVSSHISPSQKNDIVTIIRTYTYRANDDDSKNSSKKKAIEQIKIELNNEVGTYIESYLEINYNEKSGVSKKDVKQEIVNISAGITRLKVLEEKWDGKSFYLKARVDIKPKETMRALVEAIKQKSSKKDIQRLNAILKEQENIIKETNESVIKAHKQLLSKEIINRAKNRELKNINHELTQAKLLLSKYNIKIGKNKTELESIEIKIKQAKNRILANNKKACMLFVGMTIDEVTDSIGPPDASDSDGSAYLGGGYLHYGTIDVYFSHRLLKSISGCK